MRRTTDWVSVQREGGFGFVPLVGKYGRVLHWSLTPGGMKVRRHLRFVIATSRLRILHRRRSGRELGPRAHWTDRVRTVLITRCTCPPTSTVRTIGTHLCKWEVLKGLQWAYAQRRFGRAIRQPRHNTGLKMLTRSRSARLYLFVLRVFAICLNFCVSFNTENGTEIRVHYHPFHLFDLPSAGSPHCICLLSSSRFFTIRYETRRWAIRTSNITKKYRLC